MSFIKLPPFLKKEWLENERLQMCKLKFIAFLIRISSTIKTLYPNILQRNRCDATLKGYHRSFICLFFSYKQSPSFLLRRTRSEIHVILPTFMSAKSLAIIWSPGHQCSWWQPKVPGLREGGIAAGSHLCQVSPTQTSPSDWPDSSLTSYVRCKIVMMCRKTYTKMAEIKTASLSSIN